MRISEALEELNLIDKPLHNWFDEDDIDYMNQTLKTEKEQMRRVQKRTEEAVKRAEKVMGITDDVKNYGISSITKSKDQKETPVYESLNENMFEDDMMTETEASKYWDENHNYDPVLSQYKSKKDWMKDTRYMYGFKDEECPEEIDVEVTTFNPEEYTEEDKEREAFELYMRHKYGHTGDAQESLEYDKAFCPVSGKVRKVSQNKPNEEMNYEIWYKNRPVQERYEINKYAPKGKSFSTYTQEDYKTLKETYEKGCSKAKEIPLREADDPMDIWGDASFKYDDDEDLEEDCSCKGTLDKHITRNELGESWEDDLMEDAKSNFINKANAEIVRGKYEAYAEPFLLNDRAKMVHRSTKAKEIPLREADDPMDIWGDASFKYDDDEDLEEDCSCKGTLDKHITRNELGESWEDDLMDDAKSNFINKANAEIVAEEDKADAEPFLWAL